MENKRGLDISQPIETKKKPKTTTETKNVHDKLRGTFSSVILDNADTSTDQTMKQKHMQAMEDYIKQNMTSDDNNQTQMEEESKKNNQNQLYDELLQDASAESNKLEGDLGSGGAMLLGTGIAEVILLSNDDPQNKVSSSDDHLDLKHLVPFNFTRGPSRKHYKETNVSKQLTQPNTQSITKPVHISNIPSSYSQNFKLHKHQWIQQQKKQAETKNNAVVVDDGGGDDGRVGFQASRNKGEDSKHHIKKDDKYWNQFVSKQRNQRY